MQRFHILILLFALMFLLPVGCKDNISPPDGDVDITDGDSVDGDDADVQDEEVVTDGDIDPSDGDSEDAIDPDMEVQPDGDVEPEADAEIDGDIEPEVDGDAEHDAEVIDAEPEDEAEAEAEHEEEEPQGLQGEIAACTPAEGSRDVMLVRGTVITPSEAWLNGEVLTDRRTGKILCAAEDCSAHANYAEATVLCANGVVMPGMLDPHNHSWYNTIPRWKHPGDLQCRSCNPETDPECMADGTKCLRKDGMYRNRHEWTGDDDYQTQLKAYYNGIKDDYNCEMQKWAEARMMIHGTTGVAGACQMRRCFNMMVRNLDLATSYSGLDADRMQTNIYEVHTITTDSDALANYCDKFVQGDTTALLLHVAEGAVDAHNRTEFWDLYTPDETNDDLTFMTKEIVNIHGTGGYTDELRL